jgi:hypothetical protein
MKTNNIPFFSHEKGKLSGFFTVRTKTRHLARTKVGFDSAAIKRGFTEYPAL